MDIIQTFYDDLATQYDKLFLDWTATTREQAALLDAHGCRHVTWLSPEESGFYQPIVVAKK